MDSRKGGISANTSIRLRAPSHGESEEIPLVANGLLPGSVPLVISEGEKNMADGQVVNWKLSSGLPSFEPVDLTSFLNDKVTRIFKHQYLSPRSPFCSLE